MSSDMVQFQNNYYFLVFLKNNYYFLVLHLAICDQGYCVIFSLFDMIFYSAQIYSVTFCWTVSTHDLFLVAGVYMMLIIAVLRYRAAAYPLKPSISRRKLKIVCGFSQMIGLIAGCVQILPYCLMTSVDARITYSLYYRRYAVFCFYLFPTIFMAVFYYKIGRALDKQNKHMKRVCSNAVRNRYVRNRRTFLVCLGIVLCFAVQAMLFSLHMFQQ